MPLTLKPPVRMRLARFGIESTRSFAVLDKSFLDGVNTAQLQYYAQQGWTLAVPSVLMYELLSKRDERRIADLFKLRNIENGLRLLPCIGEMFRVEAAKLNAASGIMRAKKIELIAEKDSSGEFFSLTTDSLLSVEARTDELRNAGSQGD